MADFPLAPYALGDAAEVRSPALVYYRDIIEDNIRLTVEMAGGADRLWPHIKTHKMGEIVDMLLSAGVTRVKCATLSEARLAARHGVGDLLLAYPLVGPNIADFLALRRAFPQVRFYALGDSKEALAALDAAAEESVDILVDVDMGMHRTGVPIEKLGDFLSFARALPRLRLRGLHCYDGHIHDADPILRKERAGEGLARLRALFGPAFPNACDPNLWRGEAGKPLVILGGTPTFPCHATVAAAYLSPGTVFVSDYGYARDYADIPAQPGAAVLARVVSHPGDDLFTIDAGSKAVAADPAGARGILAGHPQWQPGPMSEEHWVFRVPSGEARPPIGQVVYVLPTHICPTTALYPFALVASQGEIVGQWTVAARNRQ